MPVQELNPSQDQARVMKAIKRAHRAGRTEVTLGGLAGTGKTFVASRLCDYIGVDRAIYLAPTGKAARNLARRLSPGALVSTIHGHIYGAPLQLHCTECPAVRDVDAACHGETRDCGCRLDWSLKQVDADSDMVIVDESSMVSRQVYDDLCDSMSDVFKVFVGDHGQLPAHDGFNLMEKPDLRLEKIHRQAKGSPIITLSRRVRDRKPMQRGVLGDGVTRDYPVGLPIGWDLRDNDAMILAWRREDRLKFNRRIRGYLGLPEDRPAPGDLVICRDKNEDRTVVNGIRGRILSISKSRLYRDTYKAEVDLFEDGGIYEGYVPLGQFNSADPVNWQRGKQRWEYAYALTVHLAQGSEAKRVVLVEDSTMSWSKDWSRWLYTGITRASQQLTILVYPNGCP